MTFLDIRNLQERRQARDSQFEGTRDIRNGYLFEVNGSVAGDRDGLVWFKAIDGNSEPFQVFYNGVIGDLRANMFVKIERNPKQPARWQVIEFDTGIYFDDQSAYEQLPSLSVIPAKEDYEWPPGYPGAKALNIFPRSITDFAVRPTSPASMKARVYSGIYPGATNYERFQGPVNTKDFTADVPGAGLARLAAISIDSSGTLNYTNGSTFVDGLPMPDAALPAVPASEMLISAVRLVNGMTAIEESNFDLEMRPLLANGTVNVKVSEIWESDFGAVALAADASGNITINGTRTLTVPTDIIHAGDTDTKLSFTDDVISLDAGGINLLKLTETTQDLVEIGDVAGSGDVDVSINNGEVFIQGSSGYVGVGRVPTVKLDVLSGTADAIPFRLTKETSVTTGYATNTGRFVADAGGAVTAPFGGRIELQANNLAGTVSSKAAIAGGTEGSSNRGFMILQTTNTSNTLTDRMYLDSNGNVGINVNAPQGHIHSYDAISGFLLWEYDGLNATVREIIPNGTGDVLYRLHAEYVLRDSAGAVASGSTDVSNAASVNLTVGTNTVRLRVNADGSTDTSRTAGSDTIKVAYTLRWL